MPFPRFGPLLARHLDEAGLSQSAFARATGSNQSFVSQVVRGIRKPPITKLPAWARSLRLRGEDRRDFIEAGELEHAPDAVQRRYRQLAAEVARFRGGRKQD